MKTICSCSSWAGNTRGGDSASLLVSVTASFAVVAAVAAALTPAYILGLSRLAEAKAEAVIALSHAAAADRLRSAISSISIAESRRRPDSRGTLVVTEAGDGAIMLSEGARTGSPEMMHGSVPFDVSEPALLLRVESDGAALAITRGELREVVNLRGASVRVRRIGRRTARPGPDAEGGTGAAVELSSTFADSLIAIGGVHVVAPDAQ